MPNEFKVKNGLLVSGSANINSSGSGIFTVDGISGRLFAIEDTLSGSLFSVNTAAGLPIIEAFSDNTVRIGQYGQQVLFVSQSRVGIGKETGLNGTLDVSGSVTITGSVVATSFTGSLLGTASFATSASQAITSSYVLQAVSASIASTASSADNFTVRNTLTAQTIVVQTITSSIDFVTGSSRFGSLITNTHQFTGSVSMTGSLTVIGPVSASSFTGSILGTASTASFVLTAQTASYVLQAVSASFATLAQTANTASFVLTAQTASFVLTAQTASFVNLARSASYVLQAVSASFASNADLLDGLNSTVFATTGSNTFVGNQTITGSLRTTGSLIVTGSSFLNGNVTLGDGVYFDDLNNRLGIGVSSPTQVLDISAPNAVIKLTSSTGTNPAFSLYSNTGGDFYLGVENSIGGNFGATAYAGLIYHSAREIEFFPAATRRMALKTTGQMQLHSYTSTSSFVGTVAAVLAVDSSGNVITTAASGSAGGGGGTPGGANTTIQFNDSNAFSGSGNFTFTKATNTVRIQASGSALLVISGSQGELLRVQDSGSSPGTLAVISSGSVNVFTFTTSSLLVTGSVNAGIETDALYYGRIVVTPATNQNDYSPTGWNDVDPNKATTINLTVGASIKITGLAGGVAGRIAVLKNTSSDRLVILEDNSTASTAANRFDFRNPIFLLPNGSITLIYDGVSSRWEPLSTSGGIGFGAFFDTYDDFLGAAGTFTTTAGEIGRFAGIGSGTGASGQANYPGYLSNTTEKPLGVVQIDTGTTTTGRANLGSADPACIIPANGQAIFLSRIAVEALSNATDEYQIFAGFHDAVGATSVTDGVYWQYVRTASTAWQGATANNTTRTTTGAAGPTVDTNYIWLGIYVDPTWARATYFYSTDSITWIFAGEITTNLPPQTRATGFGVTINKTAGTGQTNCSIDLLAMRYDLTRG